MTAALLAFGLSGAAQAADLSLFGAGYGQGAIALGNPGRESRTAGDLQAGSLAAMYEGARRGQFFSTGSSTNTTYNIISQINPNNVQIDGDGNIVTQSGTANGSTAKTDGKISIR
jgi:hypothetical protein